MFSIFLKSSGRTLSNNSDPGLLDLDLGDLPDCAEQLHVSAKHLGDWVADQRPDLLLLVTHQVGSHSCLLKLSKISNIVFSRA